MRAVWASRQEELLHDWVVSPHVFDDMVDRLCDFVVPYQHCLATEAGKRNVHLYLTGLLSHLDRKNAEEIAALVDVERLVMQQFIGTAPWDHRPLVEVLVSQVVDRLGEPDGVIAFDPSSYPKRGTHSVGVKRQWCGHRGKVDNCQVGVYMGGCRAVTMPCSTSDYPSPRTGLGTSNSVRNVMCRKTWNIARGMRSAWRCSTCGASRSRTAGWSVTMSSVVTRGFATNSANVANGMCWGCPATPRCATWRPRCLRIKDVDDGRSRPGNP